MNFQAPQSGDLSNAPSMTAPVVKAEGDATRHGTKVDARDVDVLPAPLGPTSPAFSPF